MPEKTVDEIQEEIEHTRAELDSTLDEIGRRLSPSEIRNRTVSYVKHTAEAVRDTVQRNPVPVTVAGTALAALILARRRSSARRAREREEQFRAVWDRLVGAMAGGRPSAFSAGNLTGRTSDLATDASDHLVQVLSDAIARAQERREALAATASRASHVLGERLENAGHRTGESLPRFAHDRGGYANGADRAHELAERLESAGRKAGERAQELRRTASAAAERLVEDLTTTSRAHPYLTVAVALATGVLLASALRR